MACILIKIVSYTTPFTAKPYIIITTLKAPSLSAVSETFQVIELIFFFFFFSKDWLFFPRTMEISQEVSKMWNIVRNV